MKYLYQMHKQSADPEYLPGTCNIGRAETRRRYRYGYAGLFLSIFLILVIESMDAGRNWRVLLCLPVGLSLTGLLQARQRFCFNYGLRGVFSIKGMRMITQVPDDASRLKDRKTALGLLFRILAGTILITLVYYFFPL